MKVLILAALLCMNSAVTHAAPADVVESLAEENIVPEEAVEVENMMEGPLSADVVDRMAVCSPGWFQHGSRCFLMVKSGMNWPNAERYCVGQQGSLASVQSPDEYNFLQSVARLSGQSTAWIGGFYFQGAWMWIGSTGFYYTNWLSQNSGSSYPCLYLNSNGGWSNNICSTSRAFFCARRITSC